MRGHTRLEVFRRADKLARAIDQATTSFPRTEAFGLTAQMRRAAVSVVTNIVEGCARCSETEYLRRFLDIAYGSVRGLNIKSG